MNHTKMAAGLVQSWVPVTDEQGRVRLEAHWVAATPVHAAAHAA